MIEARGRQFKVAVVLPAYYAQKTVEQTVRDLPRQMIDDIIFVDDASNDRGIEIAKNLGLIVHKHMQNKGYGGNQKTCYKMALERGADIVVMVHPDYQYDPKMTKYFIDFIAEGYFDVVLGTRIRSRKEALSGGMPVYKYFSNRVLTIFENMVSGLNLSEWHTGMRGYTREVLEKVDFMKNSDDFIFDTQMLFKVVGQGFKIGEVPVPVKYFEEASSINFKKSLRYGLLTLKTALSFFLRKLFKTNTKGV